MKKSKNTLLAIGTSIVLSMLASGSVFADPIVINDRINPDSDVDHHELSLSGGTWIINVLAMGHRNSTLDSTIHLFNGTASSVGSWIAGNDDSGADGWDDDGSISMLDSFMQIVLAPGDYVLAVCSFYCSPASADTDRRRANPDGGSRGRYRVTISKVPEPGTLALLGLGLAGLGFARGRKANAA